MADATPLDTHVVSDEDFQLLERAKVLKAALERARSRAPLIEPFEGTLGEALAWLAWGILYGEPIDFTGFEDDSEISTDLEDEWGDVLKQAFPDEKDPIWGYVFFDPVDDPFYEDKMVARLEAEDAKAKEDTDGGSEA